MHCNPIKISERFIKKKEGQLFKMASLVSSTASCPTPKRAKSGVRHHLQLSFGSQTMKEAFLARLDRAKQRLFPEGGTVDNYRLFTGLLDALDGRVAGDVEQREEPLATPEPLLDSSG